MTIDDDQAPSRLITLDADEETVNIVAHAFPDETDRLQDLVPYSVAHDLLALWKSHDDERRLFEISGDPDDPAPPTVFVVWIDDEDRLRRHLIQPFHDGTHQHAAYALDDLCQVAGIKLRRTIRREPTISQVLASLQALGAAARAGDRELYKASLGVARARQATDDQILDAYQWGRRGMGYAEFDHHAEPRTL